MFDTIGGLPLHPLVVHATEVIVPVAALALVLAALWPWFRRWAGWGPLGLAVASVILVPISTQSGESLEERVSENSALERHTQLGEGLLGWVIGLALIAAAMVAWDLWRRRSAQADAAALSGAPDGAKGTDVSAAGRPMSSVVIAVVLAVAAIAVGTGTIIQAVLIGHSGAEAVWGG